MSNVTNAIAKAMEIPGFHTEGELATLARLSKNCRTIIEIGVWKGRSSALMAEISQGIVFAVDDWRGQASNPNAAVNSELAEVGADAVRQECEQYLEPWIRSGNVRICPWSSVDAAARLASDIGLLADMVYIDGDHTYDGCALDIDLFMPFLHQGGIIAGHNYPSVGVKRAVKERIGDATVEGRIWWVRV